MHHANIHTAIRNTRCQGLVLQTVLLCACACARVYSCMVVCVGAAAAGARNISDPNMYNGALTLWAYMIVTADR